MDGAKVPRVAVVVETSNGWGRAIVRGIGKYVRTHRPWHIWIDAWGLGAPIPLPGAWRGDGIIADVCSPAMARYLAGTRVPIVNVSVFGFQGVKFPQVTTNLQTAARLAVEHLLDRGFHHFAYCGLQRRSYPEQYRQSFIEILAKSGHECSVFKPGAGASISVDWQAHHKELIRWLTKLPKPVGVLAWPTKRGRQLIHACQEAGLLIPEQVAILVGDEDELLCDVCTPPLSGVALNSEQLGHEAAALLDRLMHGRRSMKSPVLIDPIGIVSRQSTDTLAIEDADLAQAIAFIRNHAADPIRVEDVLRVVPLSRRRLEQRFQKVLNRTPAAEIRRVHFERAKRLLAESDMPIPDVAVASGFGSPEYLAYAFKCETGSTPLKFRNVVHGQSDLHSAKPRHGD